MAMKPMKKPVAKKASVKPKTSTTSKRTVRGGPGAAGKNVSKTARQPGSSDRHFNSHKEAVKKARLEYAAIDKAYQSDPLGRLAKGQVNKYKKDFDKVFKTLDELKANDKSFVKSGYKAQFSGNKKKK
jgi:hypothetical protein